MLKAIRIGHRKTVKCQMKMNLMKMAVIWMPNKNLGGLLTQSPRKRRHREWRGLNQMKRQAEMRCTRRITRLVPRERKQCLFCPDQVFVLPVHYKKNHPEYREIVSKDWQFDCQQCQMKFHSKIHLDAHMRIHNKHKCVYCALQFDSSRALSGHLQTHQKDGVFPCPMCARTFPLFKTFRVHYQRQHDVKSVLVCEVCQVVCRNRVRLKLHMQSHNKDYRHACTQCGKRFHAVRYLRAHVRWVHEGNLKEYKKDYLNKRKQKEQKGLVEAYKDPRKKLAFEDFPYKCHECQLGYMRRSTLMNHVKEKHPDMDPQNVPL
ncbi:zinc finger protein 567-like [Paramacrobiotus metropolitanus]|uniref:zinc finger protein 567-like n=1 Tax=Paramacrobiotus metropolitanus TaxID=2943436 RepID=UPI002445B1E7|nr:zinc finger protein 567-like [Paramacrobiotus metropolitanus]